MRSRCQGSGEITKIKKHDAIRSQTALPDHRIPQTNVLQHNKVLSTNHIPESTSSTTMPTSPLLLAIVTQNVVRLSSVPTSEARVKTPGGPRPENASYFGSSLEASSKLCTHDVTQKALGSTPRPVWTKSENFLALDSFGLIFEVDYVRAN
ncbi:hypothetical protein N431DRAFT_428974 [Stipitochalara longipes BDJ]|nr:hypothetical protein N431DRAFT_428974 [Stipitochalara longipes BDJ]